MHAHRGLQRDRSEHGRRRAAQFARPHLRGHPFDAIHLLVEKRTSAWVVQIIATVTGGELTPITRA